MPTAKRLLKSFIYTVSAILIIVVAVVALFVVAVLTVKFFKYSILVVAFLLVWRLMYEVVKDTEEWKK